MKRVVPAVEPAADPVRPMVRRERRDGLPKRKMRFISRFGEMPAREAIDTTLPVLGQRKRKKARRAKLHPPEA